MKAKMNEEQKISEVMSILGKRTSAKKKRAARANARAPRKKRHRKHHNTR
jgi:hypothetical protein